MISTTKSIKGREWTFNLITQRQFDKRHPEFKGRPAICHNEDSSVDCVKNEVNFHILIHEIMHCFYFACENEASEPTPYQVEEICCEIIGGYYFEMGKIANEVLEFFLTKNQA